MLGCDTTSHIKGVEKVKAIGIFKENEAFRRSSQVFLKASTGEEILSGGERAMLSVDTKVIKT